MILPVSNILSIKKNTNTLSTNSTKNIQNSRNITFKGRYVNGKYYTDQELADVKAGISQTGEISDRYSFFKYVFTSAPERHIEELNRLRNDLEIEKKVEANRKKEAAFEAYSIRLAREASEAERRNKKALKKAEYLNKLNNIQNQIKIDFCDKINMEAQGAHIEKIPNTIMIEDPYDDISKELIKYIKNNSKCKFSELNVTNSKYIDNYKANNYPQFKITRYSGDIFGPIIEHDKIIEIMMDNLDEELKNAKSRFLTTKERTIIYMENFDKLITTGQNSLENIDSLKDIMCRAAKDFGSTIIFRTKDTKKLVSETIQPHRLVNVLVNFKSVK